MAAVLERKQAAFGGCPPRECGRQPPQGGFCRGHQTLKKKKAVEFPQLFPLTSEPTTTRSERSSLGGFGFDGR